MRMRTNELTKEPYAIKYLKNPADILARIFFSKLYRGEVEYAYLIREQFYRCFSTDAEYKPEPVHLRI
ncbi:hypothetical protein YSY43_32280 [Paenibacillus sp. YSY-4.3]